MRKLYKTFLIIFILIQVQISFNNNGLHSILHNDIDDTESTEQIKIDGQTDPDAVDPTKTKIFETHIDDIMSTENPNQNPPTSSVFNSIHKESKDENKQIISEDINDLRVSTRLKNTYESSNSGKENIKGDNLEEFVELKNIAQNQRDAYNEEKELERVNKQEDGKTNTDFIGNTNESNEDRTSGEAQSVKEEQTIETATEVPVKKVKPDIESFEEWKDIKLKEEAKLKAEKKQNESEIKKTINQAIVSNLSDKSEIDANLKSSDVFGDDVVEIDPFKTVEGRKKNYASPDCGAKLISHNPESNHPSNILIESKDDYMLNSCSNRVWFTVELCEPIRIVKFELANLELFSNVPKHFRVYASERFHQSTNSKEWPNKYLIGVYEAKNVRTIQQFLVEDTINQTSQDSNRSEKAINPPAIVYNKYVRFEMISHYGNQHYCPLSLLRIYGTTVSEDDDLEPIEKIRDPIFTEEIPALPKQVEIETATMPVETIKPFQKTATALNEMSVLFFNNLISLVSQKLESFTAKQIISIKPTKSTKVIELDNITKTNEPEEQIIIFDLYKMLCSCHSFVNNQFLECCQCLTFPNKSEILLNNNKESFNWLNDKCGYFFMMNSKDNKILDGYLKNMKFSLEDDKRSPEEENLQDDQSYLKITMNKINYFIENNLIKDKLKMVSDVIATKPLIDLQVTSEILDKINNIINKEESVYDSTPATTLDLSSKEIRPGEENKESDQTIIKLNETDNSPLTNNDLSFVKQGNEENIEKPVTLSTDQSSISIETLTLEPIESLQEQSQTITHATTTTSLPPVISTQIPTTSAPPLITKDPILAYNKDPVLTRLTNRVKILELNMSLSSQYLEKLSQHYRIQMDEMESTFNFTTTALKQATRVSDERDHKQHERIIMLEKRLEALQNLCDSYEAIFDDLKFQSDIQTIALICIITALLLIEFIRQCCATKRQNKMVKSLSSKQIEILIEKRLKCLVSEYSLLEKKNDKLNNLESTSVLSEGCSVGEKSKDVMGSVETLSPNLPDNNKSQLVEFLKKVEVI